MIVFAIVIDAPYIKLTVIGLVLKVLVATSSVKLLTLVKFAFVFMVPELKTAIALKWIRDIYVQRYF